MAVLFENIASILNYINPFSDNFILKGVLSFLGDILSYINPFSDNFFGYKIIGLIGDLLEFLFVPSESRLTAIPNLIRSKFDFIDSIKIGINSTKDMLNNIGNAPKLTINFDKTNFTEKGNYVILDLSWYAPFKVYGDLVLTGFIYLIFLWRFFISIPNIINGVGGISYANEQINDINRFLNYNIGKKGR